MSNHRGGGHKRVRDNGGWGSYYSFKNRNRRDRYAELDSSAATAINAGPQPTLARRRRQLAEDKWGQEPQSTQKGEEIFQDLVSSHNDQKISINNKSRPKANPMLINSRKSFWKRKLSNLSTKDFDALWKEGRNKFLKYCNSNNHGQASAATAGTSSVATGPKDGQNRKEPPTSGLRESKNANSGTAKARKPISTSNNRNDKDHGPKSIAKVQKPTSSTAFSSKVTDLEVIDLCDSEMDEEEEAQEEIIARVQNNKIHPAPTKNEIDGGGTSAEQDSREQPAAVPTTAPAPIPALPPTAREPNASAETAVATTIHPKTTAKEPTNAKESITNRWSKLFLGPNFRTDNVFSLDDGDGV